MKRLLTMFCAVTIFLMLACQSSVAREEMREYTDAVKLIEVKAGETFTIRLSSNPSTGFEWGLVATFDASVIQPLGSEYIKQETKLIGAGGEEIWKFKAQKAGKTKIQMEYARSWEKGIGPARAAEFEVIVKASH